ncbi:MAG: WD40 repeat domain-containing protein [Anaerolineae bacterium]|nr:WD40 repeat domain-containing protein [Anaerolineae bacterium]
MTITKSQGLPIGTNLPGKRLDVNPVFSWIAVSSDQGVEILDYDTLAVQESLTYTNAMITDLKWGSSGQMLAVAMNDRIDIWQYAVNPERLELLKTLWMSHYAQELPLGLFSIDWKPDEKQILGVYMPYVYVWDIATSELVMTYKPSPQPILSAAWSPDGNKIAMGDLTGSVTLHHLDTNQFERAHVENEPAVSSLAWEPSSGALAAGTSLGYDSDVIQLFVLREFFTTIIPIYTDSADILSLEWNATNPNFLAAGSYDGDVTIWGLNGLVPLVKIQTGQPVASVSWSPDGSTLVYVNGHEVMKHSIAIHLIPSAEA